METEYDQNQNLNDFKNYDNYTPQMIQNNFKPSTIGINNYSNNFQQGSTNSEDVLTFNNVSNGQAQNIEPENQVANLEPGNSCISDPQYESTKILKELQNSNKFNHWNAQYDQNKKTTNTQGEKVEYTLQSEGKVYKYFSDQILGKGAFGTVYQGVCQTTGQPVALKQIKENQCKKGFEVDWAQETQKIQLERELDAMIKLQHPNIVQYIDHFRVKDEFYIVPELCDQGSLLEFFKKNHAQLTPTDVLLIAWDIASGLLEIHSHKIAHRDLKPENILVKTENINGQPKLRFKISDFGAAKSINAALEEQRILTRKQGTFLYKSPEYIRYDLGAEVDVNLCLNDVWALGIIYYILISGGSHPFLCRWDEGKLIEKETKVPTGKKDEKGEEIMIILDNKFYVDRILKFELKPDLVKSDIEPLRILVSKMLSYDPQKRPDAFEVCQELQKIYSSAHQNPQWNLKLPTQ